jgi:hypothetical protein
MVGSFRWLDDSGGANCGARWDDEAWKMARLWAFSGLFVLHYQHAVKGETMKRDLEKNPPLRPTLQRLARPSSTGKVTALMSGESAKKAPRSYSRHGLTVLKQAVRGLGGRVIDRRTSLGKALAQWRADLVADLGGKDAYLDTAARCDRTGRTQEVAAGFCRHLASDSGQPDRQEEASAFTSRPRARRLPMPSAATWANLDWSVVKLLPRRCSSTSPRERRHRRLS